MKQHDVGGAEDDWDYGRKCFRKRMKVLEDDVDDGDNNDDDGGV